MCFSYYFELFDGMKIESNFDMDISDKMKHSLTVQDFDNRLISRNTAVPYLSRSCDLTTRDYFFVVSLSVKDMLL